MKARSGYPRRDALLNTLEKLKVGGRLHIENEAHRNRALKFARQHKRFFVTRTHAGRIHLWRME